MGRGVIGTVVVAAATLSLGACASIVRGTDEQVAFQSNPPGAAMTTLTGLSCPSTPCTLPVPRRDQFIATFVKPGYAPREVPVSTRLSGGGAAGLAGNVLIGGLIGVGVDAYNGASQDHDPNPVVADLLPLGSGPARGAKRVRRRLAEVNSSVAAFESMPISDVDLSVSVGQQLIDPREDDTGRACQ